jgi:hypothetical protein
MITLKRVLQTLSVAPLAEAGRVRELNVVTLEMASGYITGVHDCPRCSSWLGSSHDQVEDLIAHLQIVMGRQ